MSNLEDYTTSVLNIRIERIDEDEASFGMQRHGQFEVVLSGNGYIRGIEIDYTGNLRGRIRKPDSWIAFHDVSRTNPHKQQKIIMYDMGANQIDTNRDYSILDFSGEINIIKAVAVDYAKPPSKIRASITQLQGDQFDNSPSIWDNKSENFDTLGISKKNTKKIIHISFIIV